MSGREQSAGCEDVLSATGTDGRNDAVVGQVVAQRFHALLVRGGERNVWYFVETDEVDAARQTVQ